MSAGDWDRPRRDVPPGALSPLRPLDPVLVWLLHDEDAREPVVTLDSPVIAELLGERRPVSW